MIRSKAVERIQTELGFRSDLDAKIIDALQQVQQELEEAPFLPWFLKTELAYIDTVAGEERVPLPGDFLQETEETDLWYYNAAAVAANRWTQLKKADIDTLRGTYQDTVGPPEAYSIDQAYFRIKPIPDAIYRLRMGSYFAQDDVLTTDIENKWLLHAPFLLIGKAGQLIATAARDSVAYTAFEKMDVRAMNKLVEQDTARDVANKRPVMGGED